MPKPTVIGKIKTMSLRCETCQVHRCGEGCNCQCHQKNYSRYTLYGKNSTPEKIRKHVISLRTGNLSKSIAPMNVTQIARRLGKSRDYVYDYINNAKLAGEAKTDHDGNLLINTDGLEQSRFKEFSNNHPITNHELVQAWIEEMKARGHTGKGVKKMTTLISCLEKFCNALKIDPVQLTISLDLLEQYAKAYKAKLESGEIKRRQSSRKNASIEQVFSTPKMAIRSFAMSNGVAIPKGHGGILSAKVLGHGQYSDVKLSDEEIKLADKYIQENFGLDSDFYRIVFVGIESCARKEALLEMNLDWEKSTDDDKFTTFFMTAFESKTEHIEGGKRIKYIQRQKTQQSLEMAKSNGYVKLWNSKEISKRQYYDTLRKELKKLYTYLGKTNHYFFEEPVHSLRHIGAHFWLRLTGYDYGVVAEIGDWQTIDELKKSYGKMPPDMIMQKVKKARKGLDSI